MPVPRPFALLRTRDQWSRALHDDTELDPSAGGGVELARKPPEGPDVPTAPAGPAGLAFDAACRLYHSVPAKGGVERIRWRTVDPLGPAGEEPEPIDLLQGPPPPGGDFAPAGPPQPPLLSPRGVAVDSDDVLFVAETGARRVLVYDLWNRRLLRTVPFLRLGAPTAPVDLASAGETVWCVLDDGSLTRLGARSGPVWVPVRRPAAAPSDAIARRVAVSPSGLVVVLLVDGAGTGWIAPQTGPLAFPSVPRATDLDFHRVDSTEELVVAGAPGADFTTFRIDGAAAIGAAPLKARGYDGSAIVRTPDEGIGFWTDRGLRLAVVARARYVASGRVTTYRLDSGAYHTDWGRLFLDACIPKDADVRVAFATADDVGDEPPVPPSPPPNLDPAPKHPELTPPLPPPSLVRDDHSEWLSLHRRETGRELPWARLQASDPFETYEAPVKAPPGRFLWITLELSGNGRVTPRIRSLRAEHPSHDLLRRLPKTYSRDGRVADFLRRYLALFDGTLGELEARNEARYVLLDPYAAPEEVLPWLASFLGLTLDERWPLLARRQLIDEIPQLWRKRGTVAGLTRYLELYLDRPPLIVEHYRLRGLGGALLSNEASTLFSGAVVGHNLRVGGSVGETGEAPLAGTAQDAFTTHAHRFSVVVPQLLDSEALSVVVDVLETHRPAHTMYDLCTASTGMRVGLGLHVGLISTIGRGAGWDSLQVGGSLLGRASIVGRPGPGSTLGSKPLERMRLA
jgi:phage tail-like protein